MDSPSISPWQPQGSPSNIRPLSQILSRYEDSSDRHIGWTFVLIIACAFLPVIPVFLGKTKAHNDLFTANRLFPLEPSIFARLRWAVGAQQILENADKRAQGRPYRLSRGDKDLIVLPTNNIAALNCLGPNILNSRKSHAFTLLGNLTGMQVVEKTSYHVRMLQGRISPALPELFAPTAKRISNSMREFFPQEVGQWTTMRPLPAAVRCFSQGIALVLYGAEMSRNPRIIELTYELTEDIFKTAFAMRCVPSCLQTFLVWLLPSKWRIHRQWRELGSFVKPEVMRQKQLNGLDKSNACSSPDLVSWMVKDGRSELERDPDVLTTLCGSVAAGSTYSIANFVCRALSDLVAHPDVLDAVRSEIHAKNAMLDDNRWNIEALQSLDTLESAMKETARLAPGTLIVYSRVVQEPFTIDGIELSKGQFITMSGPSRAMDPALYHDPTAYHGLRFCANKTTLQDHRARPFRSVDTDILAWGAGRWACPGRLVADMAAKIVLIKLLYEYEFSFVGGKALKPSSVHEFLFFHPDNQILVRRRQDVPEIKF